MTIFEHPHWPSLLQRIRVQTYDRDGGHKHPRYRLEVYARGLAPVWLERYRNISVACVACGKPVFPVRQRRGSSAQRPHLYLAMTCELSVNYGCARSRVASEAYTRIILAVQARDAVAPPPEQPSLFGEQGL